MGISRAKEFCLWVVSPQDGKVRKLRLSLGRVAALALAVGLATAAFFFVASDYARVQALRAKNYIHLKLVSAERDQLLFTSRNLESLVQNLRSEKKRVVHYEKEVKERVDQLAAILRSVDLLPAQPKKDNSTNLKKKGRGSMGGAEVRCDKLDSQGRAICPSPPFIKSGVSGAQSDLSLVAPAFMAAYNWGRQDLDRPEIDDAAEEGDMVEILDNYIEILRQVPLGMPAAGRLESGFGMRISPFGEGLTLHTGIDFSMPAGSVVAATADGIVKQVKYCRTYGLMVDIKHSNRMTTRYAHLQRALVKPGKTISRGEIIALSGSSGRSTGPHLHYEVILDGRQRNPMRYLELPFKLGSVFS